MKGTHYVQSGHVLMGFSNVQTTNVSRRKWSVIHFQIAMMKLMNT